MHEAHNKKNHTTYPILKNKEVYLEILNDSLMIYLLQYIYRQI